MTNNDKKPPFLTKSILKQYHLGTSLTIPPNKKIIPKISCELKTHYVKNGRLIKMPSLPTGNEPFMNKKYKMCIFHIFAPYHRGIIQNTILPATTHYINVDQVFNRFCNDGHIVKKHIYKHKNGELISLYDNIMQIENTIGSKDDMANVDKSQHIYIIVDPHMNILPGIKKQQSIDTWPELLSSRVFIYNTLPLSWDWALARASIYMVSGLSLIDSHYVNVHILKKFIMENCLTDNQNIDLYRNINLGTNLIYLPLQMSYDICELNRKLCTYTKKYDIGVLVGNGSCNDSDISKSRYDAIAALQTALKIITVPGKPVPTVYIINREQGNARDIEIAQCKIIIYFHPNKHYKTPENHECDRLIMAGCPLIIESGLGNYDEYNDLNKYYNIITMETTNIVSNNILQMAPAAFFRNNEPLFPVINQLQFVIIKSINITYVMSLLNIVNSKLGPTNKYQTSYLSKLAVRAREANYSLFMSRLTK